jgi:hypothetical protein
VFAIHFRTSKSVSCSPHACVLDSTNRWTSSQQARNLTFPLKMIGVPKLPNPSEPEPRTMIDGSARCRCRCRCRVRNRNRTGSDYDNEKFFDGLFKTFGLRD